MSDIAGQGNRLARHVLHATFSFDHLGGIDRKTNNLSACFGVSLTDNWQDWRMKKVPYLAGAGLAGVVVVVWLSWGSRDSVTTAAPPVFPTAPAMPETIQLFSAFGVVENYKFPPPAQPSHLTPDIRLPPKKVPQVQ